MADKRRRSSKRQKTEIISVRATPEEKTRIKQHAEKCSLGSSGYLLQVGLNFSVTSKVDSKFYYELLGLRSELSKVGGLFKAWLSPKTDLGKHPEAEEIRKYNLKKNVAMLNNIDMLTKKIFDFVEKI